MIFYNVLILFVFCLFVCCYCHNITNVTLIPMSLWCTIYILYVSIKVTEMLIKERKDEGKKEEERREERNEGATYTEGGRVVHDAINHVNDDRICLQLKHRVETFLSPSFS